MAYPLQSILFLDIETVPQQPSFGVLSPEWQELWTKKSFSLLRNNEEEETAETIYPRAGIYAEFGKIVCISCGFIKGSGADKQLFIKSFCGDDEKKLLLEFTDILVKWSPGDTRLLCAHNGKEFDFPYICRRLIINGLPVPPIINTAGKKPWEIMHLDTMELWKFGDWKSYVSLELLAHIFGIPTPKDDIDGSMVADIYYKDGDIDRIIHYCEKDVLTLANIFRRMRQEDLLKRLD